MWEKKTSYQLGKGDFLSFEDVAKGSFMRNI